MKTKIKKKPNHTLTLISFWLVASQNKWHKSAKKNHFASVNEYIQFDNSLRAKDEFYNKKKKKNSENVRLKKIEAMNPTFGFDRPLFDRVSCISLFLFIVQTIFPQLSLDCIQTNTSFHFLFIFFVSELSIFNVIFQFFPLK